jgi:hypothetical protein
MKSNWRLCPVGAPRLVRNSSFIGGSGIADVGEKSGKNTSVTLAALARVGFHLLLLQGCCSAQGAQEPWSIGEIPLAHRELRTDLGDGLVVGDPRVSGSVVRSGGSLNSVTTADDKAEKLAASDLGFAVEDVLTRPGIPILGEVVTKENAKQPRGNSDEQLNKVGVHYGDIWIQIAGGLVGIGLGCLLISLPNVQVHPRRAADGIQTGGLSASDETPCSDSSFSCAEFWDEESPGGFGMESAIFWVRRKAKLQEVAMKWLESKIAEVPDPQLQSAIAALINP